MGGVGWDGWIGVSEAFFLLMMDGECCVCPTYCTECAKIILLNCAGSLLFLSILHLVRLPTFWDASVSFQSRTFHSREIVPGTRTLRDLAMNFTETAFFLLSSCFPQEEVSFLLSLSSMFNCKSLPTPLSTSNHPTQRNPEDS